MSGPLPAPHRVLPTLNADGSRRRIRPQQYDGRIYRARRLVAWVLLALFALLPFLKMNDKPLILLDIARRQFTLFGKTFLPTEGVLLMLLLLSIFIGIFWVTALVGRAWCGWACPQTVYMEFVFRPIERWFEGGRKQQLALDEARRLSPRRVAKLGVFALISALLGNLFLAYFVGVEALGRWVTASPLEQPTPFLVMAVTALLVFFDFAYFREQMCTVACPYARLQSVLLDKRSLIVGYDVRRGEPRSKGKGKPGNGDCIDCNACVVACPTGIDIREGLQLECISCAQCIDACNGIMTRIKKPQGLIRMGSQERFESGSTGRLLRPRVVIYPLLLSGLLVSLVVLLGARADAEVTVLRGLGAPYVAEHGSVRNQVRIKIENRTTQEQRYRLELLGTEGSRLIAPQNPLRVPAQTHQTTTVFVLSPASAFRHGQRNVVVRVSDGRGFTTEVPYKLLGPFASSSIGGAS